MGPRLQDRHCYAMGVAARFTGEWADAFRPATPFEPLDSVNRYMKLPACFVPAKGGFNKTNLYGDPLWHGTFDASYTQPGDYLAGQHGTFFIASQVPLLPVLCVKTNRTLSIARPDAQTALSTNPYGGFVAGGSIELLTGWPASVMLVSHYGQSQAALPTDVPTAYLSILMPRLDGVTLVTGDIMTDDLGRTALLVGSEETELGWRLSAKMVTN